MSPVVIIGNGPSREGFDLSMLVGKAVTIGCNAVYRDFPEVDWITFIDEGVYDELKRAGWVESKTIAPSAEDLYEPADYNPPYRFKNNAGALAIKKCMEKKRPENKEPVYLFGIDCFLAEGDFLGNVYHGTENFESKVSFDDQMRRVKYIDWLCGQYPAQKFIVCVPDGTNLFQEVRSPNIVGLPFSKVEERFKDA
jgi:hypothetical protein